MYDVMGAVEILGPPSTRSGKGSSVDAPATTNRETAAEYDYLNVRSNTQVVETDAPRSNAIDVTKNVAESGPTIKFGANQNQSFHTFRHVVNGGYDATAVQSAVIGDLCGRGEIYLQRV